MRRDVDWADALGLDHLGLYHLVLFRGLGTEWSRDPDLIAGLPDNEGAAGHWLDLRDWLLGTGWTQTTLTNFERAAFRRDLRRFVYEEFGFRPDRYDALGFGPGGISFAADPDFGGGLKVLNPDGADAYAAAVDLGGPPWERFFRYAPTDLRVFYLTRRLAALEIDRGEYRQLFDTDILADFGKEFTAAAEEGLVEVTAAAVRPTPRGMFYADAVASLVARRQTEALKIPVPAPAATARRAKRSDHNGYGHM